MAGAPLEEDYEDEDDSLIDATYMEEPEIENEQSEAFGDKLNAEDEDEIGEDGRKIFDHSLCTNFRSDNQGRAKQVSCKR